MGMESGKRRSRLYFSYKVVLYLPIRGTLVFNLFEILEYGVCLEEIGLALRWIPIGEAHLCSVNSRIESGIRSGSPAGSALRTSRLGRLQ